MRVGVWLAVGVTVGIDKVGKMISVANMTPGDTVTAEGAVDSIDEICAAPGVRVKITTEVSNGLISSQPVSPKPRKPTPMAGERATMISRTPNGRFRFLGCLTPEYSYPFLSDEYLPAWTLLSNYGCLVRNYKESGKRVDPYFKPFRKP